MFGCIFQKSLAVRKNRGTKMFNLNHVVTLLEKNTVLGMEISMFTCGGPQIHLRPATVGFKRI